MSADWYEFFVRFKGSTGAWDEETVIQDRDHPFFDAFTELLKDYGLHPKSTFHYGGTDLDPERGCAVRFDDTPNKLMMTRGATIHISSFRQPPRIVTMSSARTKLKRVPLGLASSGSASSASVLAATSEQASAASQDPVRGRRSRLRSSSRSPRWVVAPSWRQQPRSEELEDHPELTERHLGREGEP